MALLLEYFICYAGAFALGFATAATISLTIELKRRKRDR